MNCQIYYNPTGGAPAAAFSLVGSKFTKIQDLTLMSASSSNVPATILMLGGPHGSSGMHTFTNVAVAGYASRAMVYSIASELNEWRNVYFNFMGGNATIGFYTSAKDDFGICSACEDTSNLSILMDHPSFTVAQSILNHVFTAIEDKTEGGTGDHYFLNGYIGLGTNTQSTGFKFISGDSAHGGFNWKVSVHNFRIENGGHGIQFVKDYQAKVYNYDIEDVTWDSSVNGAGDFMWGDVGLQLYNMRFAQNTGYTWYNNPRGSSTVDGIINSVVMENYGPIHVRAKSLGTTYIMSGLGKVTLPSGTPSSNNSVTQPSVVAPY
jgi:hypothetical protein